MAQQQYLDLLKRGVGTWNTWRDENRDRAVDLSEAPLAERNLRGFNLDWANLSGAYLHYTDLRGATLRGANLKGANLYVTNLTGADLSWARLENAHLIEAWLNEAYLKKAQLIGADLSYANLTGADLSYANLERASFLRTRLENADLTGCSVYGISVWNVDLRNAKQSDLIITDNSEPAITVDNLEVAQFIHLLLNNQKIRDVIDTITSKVVLILGRFTDERKKVLDTIRDELRKQNYLPVLFDFEKPSSRDFTETVRTLAHMSRFIIADLTDPSSIPQELQAIVPDLEVPVQPMLLEAKKEYSMFVDFRKYHWVLPVYLYRDQASLITSLKNEIIEPADKKARELAIEKAKRLERL